jgi:hypothetical protein
MNKTMRKKKMKKPNLASRYHLLLRAQSFLSRSIIRPSSLLLLLLPLTTESRTTTTAG